MRKIQQFYQIAFGVFLLISTQSKAQFTERKAPDPTKDLVYIETSKKASHYYLQENYKMALQLYLRLDKMNPEDATLNYRTGICYLNTTNKSQAIPYLEKCKELDKKNMYSDISFFLGEAYHAHQDFDKAISLYNTYKTTLNAKHESEVEMAKEVDRIIEQCNFGKKLCLSPAKVTIEHLSSKINSPYPEKSPLISYDGKTLFFSSGRPMSTGGELDPVTEQYYDDIYFSTKINNSWSPARQMKAGVNTNRNDAPLSISSNGKRLYICSSKNNSYMVFYSDWQDTSWSAPVEMDKNIDADNYESGGCISSDGKTFYFASDQDGGFGGNDIYKCTLKADNSWGAAENLGPEINSPYNDEDPYVLSDGKTLYFSSQGHTSMGGYDIFVSRSDGQNKWSTPQNLGYPINTAEDEISISWSGDGKTGYYSKDNESGFGGEDIYTIQLGQAPKADTVSKPHSSPVAVVKPPVKASETSYSTIPKQGDVLKEQVHFAFNESKKITEYSRNKIVSVISLMEKYPSLVLEVDGFTENSDNPEYSAQVAKGRALAVMEYMIGRGIDKSRLHLNIVKENLTGNEVKNSETNIRTRRVEFKVMSNTGLVKSEE